MIRLCLCAVLFVASCNLLESTAARPLLTSSRPVHLKLKRIHSNSSLTIEDKSEEIRTKPAFFADVLNLKPGDIFGFDLLKWHQIKDSGLFSNLTAKAALTSDGATLFVEGDELPAITFSPEVTVSASIDDPQVAGGVTFCDRNFGGLGQRLELQFLKKEGTVTGVSELPMTIHALWKDNVIGKTSYVSFGLDEEDSFENPNDLFPYLDVSRLSQLARSGQGRLQTKMQRFFMKIRDSDVLKSSKRRRERNQKATGTMVHIEIEPYRTMLGANWGLLSGAKSTIGAIWKGVTTSLWHDGGFGSIPDSAQTPYHQVGVDIDAPPFEVFSLDHQVSGINNTVITKTVKGLCKLSAKLVNSWGVCVPLLHYTALGDSLTVRGYSDTPPLSVVAQRGEHSERVNAFAALKADVYATGIKRIVPGVFCDAALFRRPTKYSFAEDKKRVDGAVGVGAYIRGMQLRLDIGYPLFVSHASSRRKLRFHLGIDTESLC